MLSSSVLPPAASAAAERCNASPMPEDEMANSFPTLLNASTIDIEFSASTPNAFMVEIRDCVDSLISETPSPTFLYTSAASASSSASLTE